MVITLLNTLCVMLLIVAAGLMGRDDTFSFRLPRQPTSQGSPYPDE